MSFREFLLVSNNQSFEFEIKAIVHIPHQTNTEKDFIQVQLTDKKNNIKVFTDDNYLEQQIKFKKVKVGDHLLITEKIILYADNKPFVVIKKCEIIKTIKQKVVGKFVTI